MELSTQKTPCYAKFKQYSIFAIKFLSVSETDPFEKMCVIRSDSDSVWSRDSALHTWCEIILVAEIVTENHISLLWLKFMKKAATHTIRFVRRLDKSLEMKYIKYNN